MKEFLRKSQKEIYEIIRHLRLMTIEKLISNDTSKLLDIGCQDLLLYNKLKHKYDITLADYDPRHELISREDIHKLSFDDHSFDTVLCQQVLEHAYDPPHAISELRRVAKKQLIITVPNEPFFTLFRFLVWEKEHLWAITPSILKHYLGDPCYERTFFFKRYYLGTWRF